MWNGQRAERMRVQGTSRRRGTVMLLVVGVLTLLAVIGTAYIVMARTERTSSRATSEAQNTDLARDAVMYQVLATMADAQLTPTNATVMQTPAAWAPGVNYNAGDLVLGRDGRVYKANGAHTSSSSTVAKGAPGQAGTPWAVYDIGSNPVVRARDYDYPDALGGTVSNGNWQVTYPVGGVADTSTAAEGWLARDLLYKTTLVTGGATADVSRLTTTRLNRSTGAFDQSFPATPEVRVVDPNSVQMDGVWHALPYTSAAGAHYRYAVRIVDTSRWLDLNVGSTDSAQTLLDPNGQTLTSTGLYGAYTLKAGDTTAALHAGNGTIKGRGGSGPAFVLQTWQDRVMARERMGLNPAVGTTAADAQFFDVSDEFDLRAYGGRGSGYTGRAAALWPNTLGAGVGNRNFYTTYAASRNVSSIQGGKWIFKDTVGGGSYSWPSGSYRRINLRAIPANRSEVARNAAYLANAMSAAGYTDDEALSAAINYVGQYGDAYKFASISPQGLAIPLSPTLDGTTKPLLVTITPAPTKTYLPYRAQPFLNEAAAYLGDPSVPPVLQEFAVELVQPYPTDVDVTGFRLRLGSGSVWVSNLGDVVGESWGGSPPKGKMPAQSFQVVANGALSHLTSAVTVGTATLSVDPRGQWLYLDRPYVGVDGSTQYLTVDAMQIPATGAWADPATGSTSIASVQRNNMQGATFAWFSPASPVTVDSTQAPTLGAQNSNVQCDANAIPLVLPDVFATGGSAMTSLVSINIADLHNIIRITNRTGSTVGMLMADPATLMMANATGSSYPQEAKIRMDFMADPRAQRFLKLVATVDRASDGTDQLGFGAADTPEEMRVFGRINVNTASGEVLSAIPNMNDQIVANILAYRDRLKGVKFPPLPATPAVSADFSNTTAYPGLGIRSMGELLIPVSAAFGPAGSIPARDAAWAKLFTACCTHSDSFVVYGYLEAIPDSVLTAAPGDIYTVSSTQATARRRFMALVDRSNCNDVRGGGNFAMPRVLGIKDLPN